jgi:hypothetical protein
MKKNYYIILLTIYIYFGSTSYALSYIDLSVVAVFFQMLFAGILAAIFTIKLWFKKVKDFFLRLFKKNLKDR